MKSAVLATKFVVSSRNISSPMKGDEQKVCVCIYIQF